MGYQVLYRKFRSKNFDEIIGQGHITTVLKNQIASGRISHAYLFSGPKGTGKTSTARVFARALNCENPSGGEACGKCAYCQSLTDNSLTDVIEFDAASNRGIDEIRSLRENVGFLPTKGKYRVYIIDEVHMLTAEAFNALLKTLEEPPEHIVFIFCTTEASKIPPTILSRCQRFDFKRISEDDIVLRLTYVLTETGAEADEAALRLIAANSDGALRDALSYLDKALMYAPGEKITQKEVMYSLGMADESDISAIAEAVAAEEAASALYALSNALKSGRDVTYITNQLIEYFRNLLIYLVSGAEALSGLSDEYIQSLRQAGANTQNSEIAVSYITVLSGVKRDGRYLPNPRYTLEAALVHLSDKDRLTDTIYLTAKVEKLERRLEKLIAQNNLLRAGALPVKAEAEIKPDVPEEYDDTPKNLPEETPKAPPKAAPPETNRAELAEFREQLISASKFIFNKTNSIIVSDIISQLKVKAFSDGVLYLYPTGTAVGMMDVFEMKNGRQTLAEVLTQRLGREIQVEITEGPKQTKTKKTGAEALKDVFGDMIEEVKED